VAVSWTVPNGIPEDQNLRQGRRRDPRSQVPRAGRLTYDEGETPRKGLDRLEPKRSAQDNGLRRRRATETGSSSTTPRSRKGSRRRATSSRRC
jgi:hypothetical protein